MEGTEGGRCWRGGGGDELRRFDGGLHVSCCGDERESERGGQRDKAGRIGEKTRERWDREKGRSRDKAVKDTSHIIATATTPTRDVVGDR